ncbi:MAG: GmrSD restriction endonuclease domain-containing protein [Acidimicrobiales bacterium]
MDTQVLTPQLLFTLPQRLVVPLFQRPYVWNEENQWEPLWNDLTRVADRVLLQPAAKHHPHFLGAVVLQHVQNPTGSLQERTIIDGQQRLTTLQILLDALHAELLAVGAIAPSLRVDALVVNAEPFWTHPEDRFKVWPTNRDRPAFNAVMGAEPPFDHDSLGHSGERMVEAHRFFSLRAREWLALNGPEEVDRRATTIETVARELLQMVVIDLAVDENAQEIFETLNARGAQLTAADLIKNFVFQRLLESGADVEAAYEQYWKEFEAAFWEAEVSVGRLRYPRSSIFLNHWLIARTGEDVVAREVFTRFKTYADFDAGVAMPALLEEIDRAAQVYRSFVVGGTNKSEPIDRLGLFAYRTSTLESEVVKPLVLHLLDPEAAPIPQHQLLKAVDVVESWMVRRMLVRATTKNYNQIVTEVIGHLRKSDRGRAGDVLETFLAEQTSGSRYWPDDDEVRQELRALPAYRRLRRGRLRMVLEAFEDHVRGFSSGDEGLGGQRVPRGQLHIEHVMPQKWLLHWPTPQGAGGDTDRDRLIHTVGNLTLLTGRLNAKVSNGPWLGVAGKREGLEAHDVLLLNRDLVKREAWDDAAIRARSDALAKLIIEIWPAPEGHRSGFAAEKPAPRHAVDVSDLMSAGLIPTGVALRSVRKKFADVVATVLPDGRLDVDGTIYATPTDAARAVSGKKIGGWWFWVSPESGSSLRELRREYLDSLAVDADDEPDDDEGEDI